MPVSLDRPSRRIRPGEMRRAASDAHWSSESCGGGGTAQALRTQAGHGLAEAQREPDPAQRFLTAYLAALRGAAALLAVHGRPHRGRSRPKSAWVLLASAAPEFADWADYFSSLSATRAAVAAGGRNRVDHLLAEELVGKTGQFLALVDETVRSAAGTGLAGTVTAR
jgi:hypothetical protein